MNIVTCLLLICLICLSSIAAVYIYRRFYGHIEETEDLKQHLTIGTFAFILTLIFINIFITDKEIYSKLETASYFLIALDVSLSFHLIKQHK